MSADGSGRGVGGWMIRGVTRLLPAGSVRDRYRREFLADLHVLRGGARIRYLLGVVSRGLALRVAVRAAHTSAGPPVIASAKPLLCRTGLHHHWRVHRNPDDEPYLRCDNCGLDRYDGLSRAGTGKTAANMAANLIGRPQ
jgi:hypothetical protein